MRGRFVERKGGYDCHGLPVEIAVEQKLGFTSKSDIEDVRHRRVQREVPRVGVRVPRGVEPADRADRLLGRPRRRLPHARRPSYVESVWWALKTMWDRDLLYEGHRVVPVLRALRHRALLARGLRTATRTSRTRRSTSASRSREPAGPLREGDTLLVWTTTPWTLVSNAAVAVDPDLTYVRTTATALVLAEALVERVLGEDAEVARPLPRRRHARRRVRAAVPVHPGLGVRREGPHRAPRRLRHRRRRHRHRPHRDRVRRGRLPARRRAGAQRRQPGARSTAPTTSASAPTPAAGSRTPTPT